MHHCFKFFVWIQKLFIIKYKFIFFYSEIPIKVKWEFELRNLLGIESLIPYCELFYTDLIPSIKIGLGVSLTPYLQEDQRGLETLWHIRLKLRSSFPKTYLILELLIPEVFWLLWFADMHIYWIFGECEVFFSYFHELKKEGYFETLFLALGK